jgi:hypothetical protein
MSLRIDTAEWIGGALVIGNTGLGVRGDAVPSTGTSGAPPLYNDISLPSEAADEFRALLVTVPSGGTFFMWEDSSFTATGLPGRLLLRDLHRVQERHQLRDRDL